MCLQKHRQDWKPEIRLPNGSEYVVLRSLEWNTDYDVSVVAENLRGRSEPRILSFRTSPEPTAIPGTVPNLNPQPLPTFAANKPDFTLTAILLQILLWITVATLVSFQVVAWPPL